MTEPWLQTASCIKFVLTAPTPEMVDFDIDIPEHLSRIARIGGAVRGGIYSVAQHCCIGCDAIFAETLDPMLAAYFLLHVAHEAYIGDIATPVQHALDAIFAESYGSRCTPSGIGAIKLLKDRIDSAIYSAAGLPWPVKADTAREIKTFDIRMLATERRHLMGKPPAPWADEVEAAEPLRLKGKLKIWPWPQAADAYRERLAQFLPQTLIR
jgi:hypothetical protein